MKCKCAKQKNVEDRWNCTVTESDCMFIYPDPEKCAKLYNIGPLADDIRQQEAGKCGSRRSNIKEMKEVKVKKRDMKLSDYNISREKYNELKYFCLQYWQKKQIISRGYGIHAAANNGMPRSSAVGNPTEQQAMRNAKMKEEIELIEQTAREADPEIYQWILKSVTSGVPYEYMDVPKARKQFYESRRYFFYLLSQKK